MLGVVVGVLVGAFVGAAVVGAAVGSSVGAAVVKVAVIVMLPTVFVTSGTASSSADDIEPPRSDVETAETSSTLLVSALATTVYVVELRRNACIVASNDCACGWKCWSNTDSIVFTARSFCEAVKLGDTPRSNSTLVVYTSELVTALGAALGTLLGEAVG